jgi:hypothetical protein
VTKRAELWRRQLLAAVLAAVTFGALALGATPAFGAFTYTFEHELAPSSPFGFLGAGSVAVNDANDQTYVADSGAGVVHVFQTSTGTQLADWDGSALSNPPGTPAGSFGGGEVSVAANNGTGNVYVLDSTDSVVDELSPSGEYLGQLTGANGTGTGTLTSGSMTIEGVTTATGAFSVGEEISAVGLEPGTQVTAVNGGVLEVSVPATASGPVSLTAQRSFSTPRGITVDQATGEIFVLDPEHAVIDVFSVAGAYLRQISLSQVPTGFKAFFTRGIAVSDFNGHVYVSDSGRAALYEFDASGNYLTTWTGANTPAASFGGGFASVAADNTSGDVFVTVTETTVSEPAVTDVFNSQGEYLTQFSHSYSGPRGTAVDQASHKVYVSDDPESGPAIVDIFAPLVIPDVSTEAPSQVTPAGATLNGKLNPLEVALTDCHFDWGTSSAYGQSAPCSPSAGEIPADSSQHAVSAQLTNLAPDTTYHYRLQASNANGTSEGHDVAFTTAGAGIHAESVTDVAATSVTFSATIDPNNAPTSYYFQYASADTTSCGTSSCPSIPGPPGQAIGAEAGDVEVHQHLQEGLTPGSTYHYRIVALSEVKAGETVAFFGPDQTFTTQGAGAFALPDGRAWEMVSPADKHGASLEPIGGATAIQSAAAGQAMSYMATVPTETNPQGFTNSLMQVLSRRTAEGWRSQDIEVPHTESPGQGLGEGEYRLFSPDLSLAVLQPFGSFEPALSEEASEQTAYLRTDFLGGNLEAPCLPATMHCYRPLVTAKPGYANVAQGTVFGGETEGECPPIECGPRFQGATPELSHIVLISHVALTETPIEASPAPLGGSLYEWSSGVLQLVSVLPQSEGGGGVAAGLGDRAETAKKAHAISDDGARVVWTAVATTEQLYLRDMVKGESVRLDAVQGGSGEGVPAPRFQLASSDGSKVLFTDEQRLTADAGAEKDAPDLYECEIVAEPGGLGCKLTDLTPANGSEPANVRGVVLGAGKDASRVYFVAEGTLAPGAEPGSCSGGSPDAAGCKLYVRQGGVTKLVAALSPDDGPDWSAAAGQSQSVAPVPVRVSPDGRWLAFMSQRRLTSADNRDALSGQADEEVYLYDADSQRLVCASCDPTGARPLGEQFGPGDQTEPFLGGNNAWGRTRAAGQIPGWTLPGYQSRYLSDSGRLFFNSHDALVPQDVNGTWDVYEYEPPGVGSCSASAQGFNPTTRACMGLVSSGTSPEPSAFLDASVSGADVFFLTSARLSSQDVDTSVDVYDAHECSSASPCLTPPAAPPPPCDTEASCKAAPSPQPDIFGSPASATFSGQGNLVSPSPKPPPAKKCKRGFVKNKRHKCVKKRKAKAHKRARRAGRSSPRRGR